MISVLYVDDEYLLLDIAKEFLERTGEFRVDICLSPLKAIECMKSRNYDVIVSDYQMPEMDGIIFLNYIHPFCKETPCILFTGRAREELKIESLKNCATYYLQKSGTAQSQFAELGDMIRMSMHQNQSLIKFNVRFEEPMTPQKMV